jgi:hypothetical protein
MLPVTSATLPEMNAKRIHPVRGYIDMFDNLARPESLSSPFHGKGHGFSRYAKVKIYGFILKSSHASPRGMHLLEKDGPPDRFLL